MSGNLGEAADAEPGQSGPDALIPFDRQMDVGQPMEVVGRFQHYAGGLTESVFVVLSSMGERGCQ